MNSSPHIIVLAAGMGKRMNSRLPKVLHPVLFRPMIHYVLDFSRAIAHQSICMVVGHGEEEVREQCREYPDVLYFRQQTQLGTGHAVRAVEPHLSGLQGLALIVSGDVILLKPASLKKMIDRHYKERASCTLGTAALTNPHGYGRILRQVDGTVAAIREETDCTPSEREINEVNAGIYCIDIPELFSTLQRVTNKNGQSEYYLPDVVKFLAAEGKKVIPYSFGDPMEIMGINDRHALWKVEALLQERTNRELMHQGVTLQDPRNTYIDPRCRIERDVRIEAGCVLVNSSVESGAVLENSCRIIDSAIGAGSRVKQGSYIEKSRVGSSSSIGPYAHLRPGSIVAEEAKIGNYVEIKNSVIGRGSKASHLSYIGDAEVGKDVNIGCGFITCNFDGGPEKHKTVIEDGAFIGSDCQAVAPVRIGARSLIAAGSTVTEDVPSESLAISRGRQIVKAGYCLRRRPKTSEEIPQFFTSHP